jgi:hypothetical protein
MDERASQGVTATLTQVTFISGLTSAVSSWYTVAAGINFGIIMDIAVSGTKRKGLPLDKGVDDRIILKCIL